MSVDQGFPFLHHELSVNHLKTRHVLFLVRGVPGSGKTTLVGKIQAVYPDCVICSADIFPGYYDDDGKYSWTLEKSKEAHAWCENHAKIACAAGEMCVIIDKTNVTRKEVKLYTDMGNAHGYCIMVLTPRGHGNLSAAELEARTKHNVTETKIQTHYLERFEDVDPRYYAWFLNLPDSQLLLNTGRQWLIKCREESELWRNTLMPSSGNSGGMTREELCCSTSGYTREYFKSSLLHCTAKYSDDPAFLQYSKSAGVQAAIGRAFVLNIVGFVITPKTVGARVELDTSLLTLWGNDTHGCLSKGLDPEQVAGEDLRLDNAKDMLTKRKAHLPGVESASDEFRRDTSHAVNALAAPCPEVGSLAKEFETTCDIDTHLNAPEQEQYLVRENTQTAGSLEKQLLTTDHIQENFKHGGARHLADERSVQGLPLGQGVSPQHEHSAIKHGDTAHITLLLGEGQKPVQTGYDLLEALQQQRHCVPLFEKHIENGVVKFYSGNVCLVSLKEGLQLNALFTGFYA